MRLPKKVRINNIPFNVTKNHKTAGSEFSYQKLNISVGVKRNSDRETLTGFLHEVAEISMVERGMRSAKCRPSVDSNEYVFNGSHKDFTDVMSDVSGVVGDLMKLE